MKYVSRIIGILLATSLLLVGLTAPLAVAADFQTAGYNLTIDATGLPNGTFYNLVVNGGATYSGNVEAVPGPDLVIPNAAGTVNLAFDEIIYTDMGTYERFYPDSSPFPITVNNDMTFTGTYASGSITGYVFNDTNGNGVWDQGEPGIPNATVELLGTQVIRRKLGEESSVAAIPGGLTTFLTGLTDGGGHYQFDNIPAGTFYVRATLPGGGVQESGAITLTAAGGLVSSGEADFPQTVLPYTGR